MFKIDLTANRIDPIARTSFADLNLRERDHLQEWIAKTPEALGEELLVIQKEFSGFDGTQERLDLLALDASGRLVIIENKLDDSGRDVIWQALKYAAYCSTLKTSQIIDIYARHLGQGGREQAVENISEFLSEGDIEDIALNPAGSQRIMLVAANFRREVTATALWLLGKGVNIACFQLTPFQTGDALFLDVAQIIPTPETGDYMIRLAEKSASDDQNATEEAARYRRRRAYWRALIEEAARRGLDGLARRTPGRDNWLSVASGMSGVTLSLVINEAEALAQINFETANTALNKAMFDLVRADDARIEAALPGIGWRRGEKIKSSRLVLRETFDGTDPECWPDIAAWHLDSLAALEAAMAPLMGALAKLARNPGVLAETLDRVP